MKILFTSLVVLFIGYCLFKYSQYKKEYRKFKQNLSAFLYKNNLYNLKGSEFTKALKIVADINSKTKNHDKKIAQYLLKDNIKISEFNKIYCYEY